MRTAAASVMVLLVCVGCEQAFAPCDIREDDCQQETYYEVLRVRGDLWDPWASIPIINTIGEATYRAQLEARVSEDDALSRHWTAALQLLGLVSVTSTMEAEYIDSAVTHTLAYYSEATKEVTIIDRGKLVDLYDSTSTLAHEFVHAIQDRNDGIDQFTRDMNTSDLGFARRSMIEGEALLYENLVMLATENRSPSGVDWDGYFQGWRDSYDFGEGRSRYYTARTSMLYPLGGAYVAGAFVAGGNAAVEAVLRQPPNSAREVLLGYDPAESVGDPSVRIGCASPTPPEGYTLIDDDTVGAVMLFAFSSERIFDSPDAWTNAQNWTDDRIWTYANTDTNETVVVWRLRWLFSMYAANFVDSISHIDSSEGWDVSRVGEEVSIVAASDPAILEAWGDGHNCVPES